MIKKAIIIIVLFTIIFIFGCSKSDIGSKIDVDYSEIEASDKDSKNSQRVFFSSGIDSNGNALQLESESLISENTGYVDPDMKGTQREFEVDGNTYSFEYQYTFLVSTLGGPIHEYVYYDGNDFVIWVQVSDAYPEFYHVLIRDFGASQGDFTNESLEFALAAISERYGEDVRNYELSYPAKGTRSVKVMKTVDGLSFMVGVCAVSETENGFKISHLLVFPKRLQDRFHLRYTVQELKDIIENELSTRYPGAKVDSISIENDSANSEYTYLFTKNTWVYSFYATVTIIQDDGIDLTASIGCYLPFDLDE